MKPPGQPDRAQLISVALEHWDQLDRIALGVESQRQFEPASLAELL
jgi:hypothetical protein